MAFTVECTETGDVLERFGELLPARTCLKMFEDEDLADGIFEEGFYSIWAEDENNGEKWRVE